MYSSVNNRIKYLMKILVIERRYIMKYLVRNKLIILFIMVFGITIYCFRIVNTKESKVLTKDNNTNFSNFKGLNIDKANIKLKYESTDLALELPIYVQNNRYYIPVNEIVNRLGGETKIKNNMLYLNLDKSNVIVNINDSFNKEGKENTLKRKIILADNIVYMSMFDFVKILNLKTYWDYSSNTVCLYKNRDNITRKKIKNNGLPALIRLEDITAGGRYASGEALEKLRIVSDYLYKESVPFHVAWVPRYINPSLKIDNDPSEKYSMYNSDFIFTMDYFIDRDAVIGLHGYTHQYGNTESTDGIEFHRSKKDDIPADKEYAQERINKAVETSKKLDIKCSFFEVPHYAILPNQLDIVEKNFDYIYEPYSIDGGITEYKDIIKKSNSGRNITYLPTPLNYIDGKDDCASMLKRIDGINEHTLASFFYHPYIEFDDIKTYRDKGGYPCYQYGSKSVLHQVINKFKNRKYRVY